DDFVTMLFPIASCSKGAVDCWSQESAGEEAPRAFDWQRPLMHLIAIKADDENKVQGVDLSSADWSTQALSKEVSAWPHLLRDTFACDGFIRLLGADSHKAVSVAQQWRQAMPDEASDIAQQAGAGTMAAARAIDAFCAAYVAVMGDRPMTPGEHSHMKDIFVGSKRGAAKKKEKWMQSLIDAARSHPDWEAHFNEAQRTGRFEISDGADFLQAEAGVNAGGVDASNIIAIMDKLPKWVSGFRPRATRSYSQAVKDFLVAEINEYAAGERAKITPGEDRMALLSSYSAFLDTFKTDAFADWREEILAAQEAANSSSSHVQAVISSDRILSRLHSGNETDVVSADMLDALKHLRGHVGHAKVMADELEKIVKQVDEAFLEELQVSVLSTKVDTFLEIRKIAMELYKGALGKSMADVDSSSQLGKYMDLAQSRAK
ncbi:unnamed protein product, partial [Prorocentrum cordatum]